MNEAASEPVADSRTRVERRSDRELVVTRNFDAPARIVFEAWTRPELFMRWWAPRSAGVPLLSCDMDVRAGATYRVEFGQDASNSMAFFGRYVEVVPHSRLVWTNDEGEDGAVTTVTFEKQDGRTLLTFHELYPSKEAFDEAFIGMEGGISEQLGQLDELLVSLGASIGDCASRIHSLPRPFREGKATGAGGRRAGRGGRRRRR